MKTAEETAETDSAIAVDEPAEESLEEETATFPEPPRSVVVATAEERRGAASSTVSGDRRVAGVVASTARTGAASDSNARRIAASPEELEATDDGAGRAAKLDTFQVRCFCIKYNQSNGIPEK